VFTQAVLLPNLGKRFNQLTLTLFGIAALTIGLLALAAVNNLTFLFLATAVVSFGFGIQYVTLNTLISINTPENAQGGALGVAWDRGPRQTVTLVFVATFSLGVLDLLA
jgi:MFS family permease